MVILGIDQGTTGTRAVVVDAGGEVRAMAYRTHRQIHPHPGWVEHDPEEIWRNTLDVVEAAVREVKADVRAIGIANQGETCLAWEAATGRPVSNAIVWQDARTLEFVERLKAEGAEAWVHRASGLVLDPYFSASKMRWLLDHAGRPVRELRVGTLDAWLIERLTGGGSFVTDTTTASRTQLMGIETLEWDPRLLELFGVPREVLPEIRPTIGCFGEARVLGWKAPITASAVDQQAALFGQRCFLAGQAKNTYGTGCFLLMNIGPQPAWSRHGLLTTVALTGPQGTSFALDGGVYTVGTAVEWLRDGLGLIEDSAQSEALARSVEDSAGVVFIPALAGLAAPYWDRRARGLLYGLTTDTRKEHVVRALLEGIALRVRSVVEAIEQDSGITLGILRADGGLSHNGFLMQFQADVLGIPVETAESSETTALGVAYMAGAPMPEWRPRARFEPRMSEADRAGHWERYRTAIAHLTRWDTM
jgi:glycerol kinase